MIIDPISDMLTRIRNAYMVGHTDVQMPYSKMKYAIAKILVDEGYLTTSEKVKNTHDELRLGLSYKNDKPGIREVKRVSTPGRRVYSGYDQLPVVLSDQGIAIVSTSQGVMTNKEARKRKLGGEVLCNIY